MLLLSIGCTASTDVVAAYKNHVAGYILKSDAGKDFLNLVQMLEKFVITIHFPPD